MDIVCDPTLRGDIVHRGQAHSDLKIYILQKEQEIAAKTTKNMERTNLFSIIIQSFPIIFRAHSYPC
jgi:hypothetical protein